MAIAVADVNTAVPGGRRFAFKEITLDSSYPANGYAVAAADFGLTGIDFILPLASSAGYMPVWDKSNSKIKLFKGNGVGVLIEETNATNVATVKLYALAVGW